MDRNASTSSLHKTKIGKHIASSKQRHLRGYNNDSQVSTGSIILSPHDQEAAKKFSSIEPPSNVKPSKRLAGTNINKFSTNRDARNSKRTARQMDSEDNGSVGSSANILCVSVQDEVDRENERLLAAEVRSST